MTANMNANTTSGQPDNSELSRFMNNGGGPEPHQGSNPGAQSDPGPKEVGFYDQASNHMGGDEGVQASAGRPGAARMGGYEGTPPNAGQRGGQNTGTSGAQTSAYSSEEEYGAANGAAGDIYGSSGAGAGQTGAHPSTGGSGAMGSETRNPVGFASGFDGGGGNPAQQRGASMGYTGESGSGGYQEAYQSRAAQRLVDMREDMPQAFSHVDERYDEKPRVADKAGEVADAVKGKAGGFFSRTRDRVEDFLTVDLNSDGRIGSEQRPTREPSYGAPSRMEPEAFETREAAPRMEPEAFETREAAPRMEPQGRAHAEERYGGPGGDGKGDARAGSDDSFAVFYGEQAGEALSNMDGQGEARFDVAARTEARQRELVDA